MPGVDREVVTYSTRRSATSGRCISGDNAAAGDTRRPEGSDKPLVVRVYGQDLERPRAEADEVRSVDVAGSTASSTRRVELPTASRPSRSRSTSTRPSSSGSSPATSAAPRPRCSRASRSAACSRSRRSSTSSCGARPRPRASVTSVQQPADRPAAAAGTSGWRRRRRARRPDPRRPSSATRVSRRSTSTPASAAAARRRGRATSRSGSPTSSSRSSTTPRCSATHGRRDRPGRDARRRASAALIAIFLLLQAAFGSWRLAALVFLTLPLALVGGVLAALIDGGELSLGLAARAARRCSARRAPALVLIVARSRTSSRDGRMRASAAIWSSGARGAASRRSSTSAVGDRALLCCRSSSWGGAGPRDRAPDGRRPPRRPGHRRPC